MIVNQQTPTEIAPTPEALNDQFEFDEGRFRVPELLEDEECWLTYDHDKVPRDPTGSDHKYNPIDYTDPSNWVYFETAMNTVCKSREELGHEEGLAGVGIALDAVDDLCLIDLDYVIEDGEIEPWAVELIEDVSSWAEVSPSSRGIHVLVLDSEGVDPEYQQNDTIEVYDSNRYCTFSGRCLQRANTEIARCDGMVGVYQRTHNGEQSRNDSHETFDGSAPSDASRSDWAPGALPRDEYYELLEGDRYDLSKRQRRVLEAMLEYGSNSARELYYNGSDPQIWGQYKHETKNGKIIPDRSRAEYHFLCDIAFWGQCAEMFDFELSQAEIEGIFLTSDIATPKRDKILHRPVDYLSRSAYQAIFDNGAGNLD